MCDGVATSPARTATAPVARLPRVLMVVESSSGGTGRHVIDLCRGLASRGCEVHLIYSTGRVDAPFLEALAGLGRVRSTPLPMRRAIHPSDAAVVWAVRRYLREFGPFDLVHGHSSKGGAVARLAALGTGTAAIYTLHGFIAVDPSTPRFKRLFYLLIELALSLRTAGVIAVSPEEQRAATGLGLGRGRVVLVPNGVDPAERQAQAPRESARQLMGAAEGDLVVGFVGRLVEQKAPQALVSAFARLAAAVPRARLVVVGAGPLESPLRASADGLGVADRVVWLGERPAGSVLAGFDVFAMSSLKEGLPYVVLEAMSAGLPVVATDSSGVESLVRTGVNGVVVPRGDDAALAEALIELARDPEKIGRYGRASLERVARFTTGAMVDGTLAVYDAVLGSGAKPVIEVVASPGLGLAAEGVGR